jgi:hypothetical protein
LQRKQAQAIIAAAMLHINRDEVAKEEAVVMVKAHAKKRSPKGLRFFLFWYQSNR